MKTVIDTFGKVIFQTVIDIQLAEGQILIDKIPNPELKNPYYNQSTMEFYEGPEEAPAPAEVPSEVALWRLKAYLISNGLEEQVLSAINGLQDPEIKTAALCIWQFGTAIERYSQTVGLIQMVLQKTDQEVDEIFIQSNAIQL